MIESKDNQQRRPKEGPENILVHGCAAKIVLVAAACEPESHVPSYVSVQAEIAQDGTVIICPLQSREMVDQVIAGLTMCRNKVWPEGGT